MTYLIDVTSDSLNSNADTARFNIRVKGTVQGVGFRPFVWHLANQLQLSGSVKNDAAGVLIELAGPRSDIERFIRGLYTETPPLAEITHIETTEIQKTTEIEETTEIKEPEDEKTPVKKTLIEKTEEGPSGKAKNNLTESTVSPETAPRFIIAGSDAGRPLTAVSADAATCPDCLQDTLDPKNRRFGYPFTNCTHCGPRFSIIRAIPYDRNNTSMGAFQMCAKCQQEYDNPADRRFHAQPNACPECGPTLWFARAGSAEPERTSAITISDDSAINQAAINAAAAVISDGGIVAIKGIGGFHLACDARHEEAVNRLRQRKVRYRKALAIMVRDPSEAQRYGEYNDEGLRLLADPAAPIILAPKRQAAIPEASLASGVAPDQDTIGILLPYTPLHHLLLSKLDHPIIMTSGNRSDEPQCIDNAEAIERLSGIADAFLLHDRTIVNRLDDSVVNAQGQVIRRARGLAPRPVPLPQGFGTAPSILAMGADLKNTFCLLNQERAIVSQYMGDLHDVAAQRDFQLQLHRQQALFSVSPDCIVIDAHPDYHSSRCGHSLAAELGVPTMTVQHHHAHIAAVMGEHGFPSDTPPVLGVALDGLGYGPDTENKHNNQDAPELGKTRETREAKETEELWGGEFLLCDYQQMTRLGRFRPAAMIGGHAAMKEPWRNALAQFMASGQWPMIKTQYRQSSIVEYLNDKPLDVLEAMTERRLNSPLSSSAGRLFDAVAAALDCCRDQQLHEGEAAMQLQALAERWIRESDKVGLAAPQSYPFGLATSDSGLLDIDWSPMWIAILDDLTTHHAPQRTQIAYRFHLTVASAIGAAITTLTERRAVSAIVFSGGVLQNRLLRSLLEEESARHSVPFMFSEQLPANDGSISFGQALIAAARKTATRAVS